MKKILLNILGLTCTLFSFSQQELIINGDFNSGNTGFTSDAPFDGGCRSRSYSVNINSEDKCGNFTNTLSGIDNNDLMMIIDSPGNDKALWKSQ